MRLHLAVTGKVMLMLRLVIALGLTTAAAFDPTGFGHCAKFIVAEYVEPEPLTNFPVLVKLSTNLPGFRYTQFKSPIAADLRFVDAHNNELPYEIEHWNTNGSSFVWVRAPVLTNGAMLQMYWAKPDQTVPAYRTNGAVYNDAVFRAVWHMETNYVRDATGHGFNALSIPVPSAIRTTNGLIGLAQWFDGYAGNDNRIVVSGALRVTNQTVSAWVWLQDELRDGVVMAKLDRMFFWQNGDRFRFETAPWGGDIPCRISSAGGLRRWIHLAATQTGLQATLYINGEPVGTWTKTNVLGQAMESFAIGGGWHRLFHGIIDECRVESGPRSAAWIKACYQNQLDPEAFFDYDPNANVLTAEITPEARLRLSWHARGELLQTATSLGPDGDWTTNGLPVPACDGETNYVLVPITNAVRFFRLVSLRPAFELQPASSSISVTQGLANAMPVHFSGLNGFNHNVRVGFSNVPIGLTAYLHPAELKTGICTLAIEADVDATPGTYNLSLVATGGLLVKTTQLPVSVVPDPPDAPYSWPAYNPNLDYNFTNEYSALSAPTNLLNDCWGVTTTITLPSNWFCFRFGTNKHSLVTSNAWIPMLRRLDSEFAYFKDVMGWPPDKRAKRGYYSAVYLYGSGTCVGGQSNDTGGWMSSITYSNEAWPMVLLSYYPVYSFDPACTYPDKLWQQDAVVHEAIHAVLADMPGCKRAAWFHEGGNTWLQGEATARRTGNYGSVGWLSAGAMLAPFMPIECYSGWLQDDSFGGPSAEGVNMYSNGVQICTWRNLLGGTQYGETFARFMGEMVSQGSVAWIWRYCTNRVLEGLATVPHGLGEYQTGRLIREFRARQAMCDFGKWSGAFKSLLNSYWGTTIRAEWEPYWINCAPWIARCYVLTTNVGGTLIPEWRTLPGWSGANQIPLATSNSVGTVRVIFTPLGSNMTCQLVYRATDGSVIYSKPVRSGPCAITPQPGKPIKNNIVIAVICNSDFRYLAEFSRTNKFDYRLTITGAGTAGVLGTASVATRWYQ